MKKLTIKDLDDFERRAKNRIYDEPCEKRRDAPTHIVYHDDLLELVTLARQALTQKERTR